MIAPEDMKIALYTLLVTLGYTAVAVVAPAAAVAVMFPCCCALILPCVVHLRKRHVRSKRERARPA